MKNTYGDSPSTLIRDFLSASAVNQTTFRVSTYTYGLAMYT